MATTRHIIALFTTVLPVVCCMFCENSPNPFDNPDNVSVTGSFPGHDRSRPWEVNDTVHAEVQVVLGDLVDSVVVSWGDGGRTVVDTIGTAGTIILSHVYALPGNYAFRITAYAATQQKVYLDDITTICVSPVVGPLVHKPDTETVGYGFCMAVTATGSRWLGYQWYRNGIALVPQGVKDTLVINTLSLTDTGVYTCIVSNSCGADTSVAFLLELPSSAVVLSAPNLPTAKAKSSASIEITWGTVLGAESYKVFRGSALTGTYVEVGTATSTAYTDLQLTSSTTYYYKIKAVNQAGESAYSSVVSSITDSAPLLPPATPSGVAASAKSSNSAEVSWVIVPGATSYVVLRAASTAGSFAAVGASLVSSYFDTGLVSKTSYSYAIIAMNSAGASDTSTATTVVTLDPPVTPPTTATGVSAIPKSSRAIEVAWNAATGATSYSLRRSISRSTSFAVILVTASNKATDTSLSPNSTYWYSVVASNSAGSADSSLPVSAKTFLAGPVVMTNPSTQSVFVGQSATFAVNATGDSISYQWQRNGVGISGASAAICSVTATILDSGASYRCIVANSGGSDTSTSAVLAVRIVAPVINSQPASQSVAEGKTVVLTVGASGQRLSYQWQKNGILITGANEAMYQFTAQPGSAPGDSGVRFVCMVSNTTSSVSSNEASISVLRHPLLFVSNAVRDTIIATSASPTINLTADGRGAAIVSGYYRIGASASSIVLNASSTPLQFLPIVGLMQWTNILVVIKNGVGDSATAVVSVFAKTKPGTPTAPAVTSTKWVQSTLSWSVVQYCSTYTVYRATSAAGPFVAVSVATPVSGATTVTCTDSGLAPGTLYHYAVKGRYNKGTGFGIEDSSDLSPACSTRTLYRGVKLLNFSANDSGAALVVTGDRIAVVGTINSGAGDIVYVRLNDRLDTILSRTIVAGDNETGVDIAYASAYAPRPAGYMIASTKDRGSSSNIWVVRIDTSGNAQGARDLSGYGNSVATAMMQTGSTFTVVGRGSLADTSQWCIAQVSPDLTSATANNVLKRTFPSNSDLNSIAGLDAGFCAVGSLDNSKMALTLLNGTDTSWTRLYQPSTKSFGVSLCGSHDGGVLVAGYAMIAGMSGSALPYPCVAKTDGNGNALFTFNSSDAQDVTYIGARQTSGYFMLGRKAGSDFNPVLVLLSDGLSVERMVTYGSLQGVLRRGVQTADGGFLLVGTATGLAGNPDILIIKTDDQGNYQ